jgi:hypothetical protein
MHRVSNKGRQKPVGVGMFHPQITTNVLSLPLKMTASGPG